MTTGPVAALGEAKYVSLTTFRRSGQAVPTAVWVARDGDALVVTTPARSGKVKRLRHTPVVEMRPCTRAGRVAPDAVPVRGRAEVVTEPSRRQALTDLVRRRYGLAYCVISLVERVVRRGRTDRVLLRITDDRAQTLDSARVRER